MKAHLADIARWESRNSKSELRFSHEVKFLGFMVACYRICSKLSPDVAVQVYLFHFITHYTLLTRLPSQNESTFRRHRTIVIP